MKKQLYNLLFLSLLLVLIVSCSQQKEEQLEITSTFEITPEGYLDLNFQQDVLFRYEFKEEATGQRTGWLIDRDGFIRDYNFDEDAVRLTNGNHCSNDNLNHLIESSNATGQVIDLEELVGKAKLIADVAGGSISELSTTEAIGEGRKSYYIYNRVLNNETSNDDHDCSGNGNGYSSYNVNDMSFEQVVLKVRGSHVQDNNHPDAQYLANWMEEINDNLQ